MNGKNKEIKVPKLDEDQQIKFHTGDRIIGPDEKMIAQEESGLEDNPEVRGNLVNITKWPKAASEVKPKKKSLFKRFTCGL